MIGGRARSRLLACALAAAALAGRVSRASAGTCSVTTVSPIAFGAYDVFDPAPVDSTGSITFECTGVGEADVVRVDLGAGSSGDVTARHLVAGAATMLYGLYLDAARTSLWGDGTGGSSTYGPVHPAEGSTTITIYGRIPAGQDVAAGSYADTITVTLQF